MPADSVTFDVTNDGPDDVHKLVVISTDLGPTELPTTRTVPCRDDDGMEVVDEIEDIPVGEPDAIRRSRRRLLRPDLHLSEGA